ncbi:interferon-like [Pseudopipra pipra]|uniref:interferon-like n=1 Tax=Pseudopipra pipra TaxID=415032 RepID=UPI0031391552
MQHIDGLVIEGVDFTVDTISQLIQECETCAAIKQAKQPCLWHGTLVLLLGLTTTLIRPCDTTFPWDSLQLFQVMAPSMPSAAAAATTLCILQQLFITSAAQTPLPTTTGTLRHSISFLHHIQQLGQYVPANGILFKGQGPCNLLLSINKYFGCIQDFLCTHHHKPCAWDHICLEAHACFQHLHNTCIMRD